MTARVFSTWNPNAVGEGLLLDQGGLVITTGVSALSNARKVIGTLPKGSSPGFYETVFWSVPRVSLGSNVATGVAQPDSPLDQAVGADSKSCAFYPATGDIIFAGSTLTTLDPIPERVYIGVYLIFSGGHAFVNFIVSGSWIYEVDLGTGGKLWLPAQTLAGGNATETSSKTLFGGGGIAFNYPRIVAPPS
jgi:hypothetical protein